jgi:hypothetical protein
MVVLGQEVATVSAADDSRVIAPRLSGASAALEAVPVTQERWSWKFSEDEPGILGPS